MCLVTQIHMSWMIPAFLYGTRKADCKAGYLNGTVHMYTVTMDWFNTLEVLEEGSNRICIMTVL
jgi:hypothetical protein